MKNRFRIFHRLIIYLLIGFSVSVHAQTSLWRVSGPQGEVFIGGTIHVLSKSDYPLPEAFSKAYEKSQHLVFETDIAGMSAAGFQKKMLREMSYQGGKTLRNVLDAPTYRALESYCQKIGLSIDQLHVFKPGMLVITLLYVELQRLGMAEAGVDQYFTSLARADGKSLGQLETPDEQLMFIATLGDGYENDLVLQTIQEMEQLSENMIAMKVAWRAGDSKKLVDLTLKDMSADYPGIYKRILVDRNNAWIPKIEKMLKTKEVEMILVGAAHLVGSDGVIELLRNKGFTVEQL